MNDFMRYDLNIDFWMDHDPKCPGCGKFHERKRVGNTATFEVIDACDWHKKGTKGKGKPIPNDTPAKPRAKNDV